MVRFKISKIFMALGLIAMSGGTAGAATYYGSSVASYNRGACTYASQCKLSWRYDTSNALGAPDGKFTSLGLTQNGQTGQLVLGFGRSFQDGQVTTWDINFPGVSEAKNNEAVRLYTLDADFNVVESLGIVTNRQFEVQKATMGFTYVKLVDATREAYGKDTNSFDGFDVDSVSIAAVPLPAAGGMLLAGLGSLAALRRRRRAAH